LHKKPTSTHSLSATGANRSEWTQAAYNSIFDFYPDLKEHVHQYCVIGVSERNAAFKINDIIIASKK
jgi:hypothetical protein